MAALSDRVFDIPRQFAGRARGPDLTDALDAEPVASPAATVERLLARLGHVITSGTPGECKRAVEARIAEIRIDQQGAVIPVFKVPNSNAGIV